MENSDKRDFKVNERDNQFELHTAGQYAFLEYIRKDDKIYLTHTEAPAELRGIGVAADLVKRSLEYSRNNKLTVVPSCSYVARYIEKHPEWNDVLSDGYQM
ncbi:N-acetyltransferase [Flavobacterium cyanobacteriorum]|uniref:N-acetyltransferase n=1 Tax=Flavobacterium cyanobacteriorum TaxID=2022802 RepID=A0A255YXL2_9FLAO|nr:GNAT family N-acetyltransferase [Flavobacterium cyanobacteriorum]OYQ33911.1 N-acetyltransferase [Flavobacterium cyanobacteriorum]